MKRILILVTILLIGSLAIGMDKEKDFYTALKKKKNSKALELLHTEKTLAKADFLPFCKEDHDETGDNDTPLLASIRNKHYSSDLFNTLLEAGADIDKPAHNNQTPLLKAIFLGRSDLALELLKRNADTRSRVHIFRGGTVDALELADIMRLESIAKKIKEVRGTQ